MVQSVALLYKQQSQDAFAFAQEVSKWLSERDIATFIAEHDPKKNLIAVLTKQKLSIDLLIVIGGDGTIISVARQMLGTHKPIVGINFGKVGFLAELCPSSWIQGLEKVLSNNFEIQKRISLTTQVERNGQVIFEQEVVNDIALTRGKIARLVDIELLINNKPFTSLRSDGLIIATPTGSTGYACSAGGPLLHQSLSSFVIAAICPFLGNFSPLVQSVETTVSIVLRGSMPDTYLTFDGHLGLSLKQGDVLLVRGNKERAYFAELGIAPYYERLYRSGFVSGTREPIY